MNVTYNKNNDLKIITIFWSLLFSCRPDTIINKQMTPIVLENKDLHSFSLKYEFLKIVLYSNVKNYTN